MNTNHIVKYKSSYYNDFLHEFRSKDSSQNQIIVYAGEFETNRSYAIDELRRDTEGEVVEIDLKGIISLAEQECYANIDEMVEEVNKDAGLIIFRNGDLLNGAYTGFSSSAVKYATPQEKYFLKKIKEIPTTLVVELKSTQDLDRRLVNSSDLIVLFSAPTSFIDKFFWNLKNIHVHGSRFLSPRKV